MLRDLVNDSQSVENPPPQVPIVDMIISDHNLISLLSASFPLRTVCEPELKKICTL